MNNSTLLCTVKQIDMIENIMPVTFLLPTFILIFAAVLARKEKNLEFVINLTKIAPLLAVVISISSVFWISQNGLMQSQTLEIGELGLSLRIDALSTIVYSMVSLIGLVVLRFSFNYLEGDSKHTKFIGRLAITIAFVQLLVLSGNLFFLFIAWVATSISLHRLILFYPKRQKARLAARKKFILARLGDLTLLSSFLLLYSEFQTGNLEIIFQKMRVLDLGTVSTSLEISAVLLVITAGLKSVQIPFHGWILEVMEAPTPVSALLHAGLLNAGPFLMIRFAYFLDAAEFAPVLLFVMGSATALYGTVVFTTQPNIKTALAYSSIGHMGFTLMLCGLGLYSASLLHLTAHSFYKAHSFLSSGSIIEKVQTKKASNFYRIGSFGRIAFGFASAAVIYAMVAWFWGVNFNTPFQLLIIGAIIFTGIVRLIINSIDSNSYSFSILKTIGAAVLVVSSFFGLEVLATFTLGSQVPVVSQLPQITVYLASAVAIVFFVYVAIQTISPALKQRHVLKNLGIHIRNGFYLNVLIDRLLGTLKYSNTKVDH